MFDKLDAVVKRFEELNEKLADPTIYDRQAEYKKISSERSSLEDVVICYKKYQKIKDEIDQSKEILQTEKDEDLRETPKKNSQCMKPIFLLLRKS